MDVKLPGIIEIHTYVPLLYYPRKFQLCVPFCIVFVDSNVFCISIISGELT